MESMVFDREKDGEDLTEEELLEEGSISSEEEAFMRGYEDEEEEVTCDECGTAIRGKKIKKKVEGEIYHFCSKDCAEEFEENLS